MTYFLQFNLIQYIYLLTSRYIPFFNNDYHHILNGLVEYVVRFLSTIFCISESVVINQFTHRANVCNVINGDTFIPPSGH